MGKLILLLILQKIIWDDVSSRSLVRCSLLGLGRYCVHILFRSVFRIKLTPVPLSEQKVYYRSKIALEIGDIVQNKTDKNPVLCILLFLKYLVEFTYKEVWDHCFLCETLKNYWPNVIYGNYFYILFKLVLISYIYPGIC